MIKYLEREEDFDNLIKKDCILDFYAEWCGPCKMIGSVLENMAPNINVDIIKINTDKFPNLANKYGVMSIPTLFKIVDGKEVKKNIGFMDKNKLNDFIK